VKRTLGLGFALVLLIAGVAAANEPPNAVVTFPSSRPQTVTLHGFGSLYCGPSYVQGTAETGSEVKITFDRIASMRVLSSTKLLLQMRSGDQRMVTIDSKYIYFRDPDGSEEKIPVEKVVRVDFLAK
jgi:hypothetical protein